MGCFRIQILLEDNNWSTEFHMSKNSNYSTSPQIWSLLNLDITEQNYGIRPVYDKKDTAHADMCFSVISITHSVY